MGGLGTFVILMTLGATGEPEAAGGPPAPGQAAPNPPTKADAEPPAPPLQYLKAGILFFNTGKYERAGKYLEAANRYRDRLKEPERVVLDVYRDEMVKYEEDQRRAAARPDPGLVQASRVEAAPTKPTKPPAFPKRDQATGRPMTPEAVMIARTKETANRKQEARWLLFEARNMIRLGDLDGAAKKSAEARGLDIDWWYLDDTPDKVDKSIAKARKARPAASVKAEASPAHDLNEARAKLREAREALARDQVDRAEALAREVASWNLPLSESDDSPDRVLDATRSVRLLQMIQRNGNPSAPATR